MRSDADDATTVPAPGTDASPSSLARRVSAGELFFDLVFVFAVTSVAAELADDHTGRGAFRALVVFVPIYWAWVGTTIQGNLHDFNEPHLRIAMFAVALSGLFMAISVPGAFDNLAVLFACSYWAARLIHVLAFVGHLVPNAYTMSAFVTGPLFIAGAVAGGTAQEWIWGAAALLDLASPTLFRRRLRGIHFDAPHLAERFSLFVLIALGESVVAVGVAAQDAHVDLPLGLTVGAAFALIAGLWWVYFHFAADAIRHALATASVQFDITRLVLSYAHLSFIGSIIAIAVGLHEAVAHPTEHLPGAAIALTCGGAAVFLATFGFTRWVMFRLLSTTRLAAAATVAAVGAVAPFIPAVATLFGLAVAIATLNVIEWMRNEQTGWRARLARRSPTKDSPS